MGMDIYYYMGPALKIESPESLDLWEFREGELEEALYELNGEGDKSSATFYGPNQDREGYFHGVLTSGPRGASRSLAL